MKTKIVALLLLSVMILGGCKKVDTNVPPTGKTYPVSFNPQFNGEIVPWLANKTSRSFGQYEHKFLLHIIRIHKGADFVADIPITIGQASSNFSFNLAGGSYTAEVLPCNDEVSSGIITSLPSYGVHIIDDLPISRAAIYTRTPVLFSVGTEGTAVTLNCVTDLACFQYSLGDRTYVEANLPTPDMIVTGGPVFLAAHNGAGLEQATNPQLMSALNEVGAWGNQIFASADPVPYFDYGKLWYDDASKIYYAYTLPGSPNVVNVPVGDGTTTPARNGYATYMTFADFTGTPVWLRDFYSTRTWLANTTLRLSHSAVGGFTITQSDWFSTILQ